MAQAKGVVVLDLRKRAFDKKMKEVRNSWKSMSKSLVLLKGAVIAVFAGAAVKKAVSFFQDSIALYGKQIEAEAKLAAAMKVRGAFSTAALNDLKDFASEIQSITTVGDETVIAMQQLGVSIAGLSGEKLKDATRAAIGLSKAFGIDLKASMLNVAKAATGNFQTLVRYGIMLKEGASDAENFDNVLRQGIEGFKLATAEADTYTGQIEQIRNIWGDFKENIGEGAARALGDITKELFGGTQKLSELNTQMERLISVKTQAGLLNLAGVISIIAESMEKLLFLSRATVAILTAGMSEVVLAVGKSIATGETIEMPGKGLAEGAAAQARVPFATAAGLFGSGHTVEQRRVQEDIASFARAVQEGTKALNQANERAHRIGDMARVGD